MIVNSNVPKQYFTVTRNNISQDLQKAVALQKLPPKSFTQAEQLANHLFSTTNTMEWTFVSTKCHIVVELFPLLEYELKRQNCKSGIFSIEERFILHFINIFKTYFI